ncbi:MAG: hydantoinase/oxoprolinase family protein [Acidimicrobiia bacterium]|nr:hydantoinase/oxoprolinase family protein [Acidimicrobiia bacterium]
MTVPNSTGGLAADVGGTFTDLVGWDGTHVVTGKVPSTTDDQSVGVVGGATGLGMTADRFLHGTTVATNALLEGRGAETALITSPGFADVIEIGRQDRPSLYDSFADRPDPLVARRRRYEASTVADLDADLSEVEAVAVSLLYGYENAERETEIAAALLQRWPELSVSLSSRVVPEFREFERTSTTLINAYLSPEAGSYLRRLVTRAEADGLPGAIEVMRSSGGLMPIAEAALLPAAILLSGPAAGVVAAAAMGNVLGRSRLVSFDMGGTSTDVCRIEDGRPEVLYERPVADYPCRMPSVAIHTVGAGGGSVAWVDGGGSLRVGPRSSGAMPGPACYGHGGTEPAVTDANVALGRIDPQGMLAGSLPIRADLAAAALDTVGGGLGLSTTDTARGIVTVVEEVMAGAIRTVSIEQGADPRQGYLVAFGGAGGLHATALARRLDMAGVIVPPHAGVFSALGLLLSPPRADAAQSVRIENEAELDAEIAAVVAAAAQRLETGGSQPESTAAFVDVRYRGQSHETTVPYAAGEGWEALLARFHATHRERNGFARPDDPVEVVTVRAESVGRPLLSWSDLPEAVPTGTVDLPSRVVLAADGEVTARVVNRSGLAPGDEITGPAVVEETEATTYLAPGERAVVHGSGALEVEW